MVYGDILWLMSGMSQPCQADCTNCNPGLPGAGNTDFHTEPEDSSASAINWLVQGRIC